MARGMRIMTVFVASDELATIMKAAAIAHVKPYAWARKTLAVAAAGALAEAQEQQAQETSTPQQVADLVTEPRRRSAVLDDLVSDAGVTREAAGALVEMAVQQGLLTTEVREGRSWLVPV